MLSCSMVRALNNHDDAVASYSTKTLSSRVPGKPTSQRHPFRKANRERAEILRVESPSLYRHPLWEMLRRKLVSVPYKRRRHDLGSLPCTRSLCFVFTLRIPPTTIPFSPASPSRIGMLRRRFCCLTEVNRWPRALLLNLVLDLRTRSEMSACPIILLDGDEPTGNFAFRRDCEIEVSLLVIVKFWCLEVWYNLTRQKKGSNQENFHVFQ